MLVANFLANFLGVTFVNGILNWTEGLMPAHASDNFWFNFFDSFFTPFAFIFVCVATLVYEKPIRQYLDAYFANAPISEDLETTACRRLLNEPFAMIVLDLSMWLLSAIFYPILHWVVGTGGGIIQRTLVMSAATGLITATIAFFFLEHILQKRLAPLFFPQGGLYRIPKTLRIRIRTRLAALLLACNFIPLISIISAFLRIADTQKDPATALAMVKTSVIVHALLFITTGCFLTMLVSRNLTIPFAEIIQTLRRVRNGHFDKKVRVTTNDEIGYTGDVINEMTTGLEERERIRHSLGLAKEVQQSLLPKTTPDVKGLDIAGASIYCEETGGDYFDYLPPRIDQEGRIKIVVGDVCDHGVSSALLMTTARAFLRQRSSRPGNLDQVVMDVNRQLSKDVEDSGRFMTLFILDIDNRQKTIQWVNAGHDPAILYDPNSGEFEELKGRNLPLAVSEDESYKQHGRKINSGHIVVIGTDGIWESQNPAGEMFEKENFKKVIAEHAELPAQGILDAVISALDNFCRPREKDDDVTLVVVKVAA